MQPGPLAILIVEDDAAARSSLCNQIGMRYPALAVHSADNGQSGLECFTMHSPDIVITDIQMPFMDGIGMAAEIKSLNPEVAIIALTSHTDVGFLLRCIEIGIDHYLLKPTICEKLYAVIDKNINVISALFHRKQIEVALLKSQKDLELANELLEQRVSERTADLKAALLEQESFSYSVSHDLRAPLRHINSFSAILNEEFEEHLPGEARNYLDRIRTASNKMGALIDHLLELSQVGRSQINLEPLDLSEVATSILDTLKEAEPKRCVEIVIENGITVLGDPSLLRQLFENLLGNAWKYTSNALSARIEFGCTVLAGQPTFFVKDDGAGFDMAYKANLFKTFQRLHGAEFEGCGIGLATAQRIIQRHGGRIWAEGMVDQGATFYFTLPVYF